MAQTIKFQLGDDTHAIVLTGPRISPTQAKELVCDKVQAGEFDFGRYDSRPTLDEQLDERLKKSGVTNFEIIEQ